MNSPGSSDSSSRSDNAPGDAPIPGISTNQALAALAQFEAAIREFTAREFSALRVRYADRSDDTLSRAIQHVDAMCADGVTAEILTPPYRDEKWFEVGGLSLSSGATAERTLFQLKLHRLEENATLIAQAYLSHHMRIESAPAAYSVMAFVTDVAGAPKVVAWYSLADEDVSGDLVYLDLAWTHRQGRTIQIRPPALLVRKFTAPDVEAHRQEFNAE